MPPLDPTIDPTFRDYADLQLHRHYLLLEGTENELATEAMENRMDELWEKLDEVQRRSLNGMASDLNWVRRKGEPPPKGRKLPEEVTTTERKELVVAKELKDWHGFLHYLRICAPTIPLVHLAYLRGSTYDALGFPAYGSVFYQQAAEFDPANASIGVIALRSMDSTNSANAVRYAEKIIASPLPFAPAVLAMCAVMVLRRDEAEDRPIDRQRFSALLNDAVERLQLEPPSDAARAMAYQLAASGFEIIDDLPAALACYDEGLKLSPDNDVLLAGKGLLLYGSQTDQAVAAFKGAARNRTSLVWPYFFLAHHCVLNKNYADSLDMGQAAWARATTNPVRAELLEWRAICLLELNFPIEEVRSIFEKAVSLDPSNAQIAKNRVAFDEAVAESREPEWNIEDASVLKLQRADSMRELEIAGVP